MEAVHTASRVSAALEKQTNLTRFSGRAFYVKLAALFPSQSATFTSDTFSLEFSTGANQAIAQLQRPVNALQQVAVKNNITSLCARAPVPASYSGQSPNSIYSDKVWFAAETQPTDLATLAAMTISRNAWLEPLPADAPEIQELAKLYTDISTLQNDNNDYPSGRGTADERRNAAHRAVCTATLLSAQFSMGMPGQRDSFRRMMVEVGSRVPTFAEIETFSNGKKTLTQYLAEMQSDPTSGYYTAVHQWHQDWLGLRSFLPTSVWAGTYPDDNVTFDPRAGGPYTNRSVADFSYLGAVLYNGRAVAGAAQTMAVISDGNSIPFNCDPTIQQAFDPRTTMVLYETKVGSDWQVQGAFVEKNHLGDYQNVLAAYGANNLNVAQECVLFSVSASVDFRFAPTAGAADYYRCRGRVNGNATSMENLPAGQGSRRMRRFAPSGEQNGVSVVKAWYSGEARNVCNSLPRFELTCALRPPPATSFYSIISPSDYSDQTTPGLGIIRLGTYWDSAQLSHPGLLNMFRCGKPDAQALAQNAQATNDAQAFPYGYDPANPGSGLGNLNDVITLGQAEGEIGNEGLAIRRLRRDLRREPYRLIDHVLTNNISYKEVFNAKYLIGHSELELFYRGQGQHLPLYPPGYNFNTTQSRDPSDPSAPIPLASFQGIPSSYFSNTMGLYGGSAFYHYYKNKDPGVVPPRPGAGVLAMPAFISPVGGKMRTIASRYFTRLLCGDPSIFVPTSSEKAIHARYMLDVNNPAVSHTAAQHLDGKTACFGCHVNLDPLGAALSSTFLPSVQIDEKRAATGDMSYLGVWQGGNWLGAIYHPTRGTGAFLGAEVTGLEGVANQMVTSPLWSKCVVDKTFENVFGRVRTIADTDAFNSYHKKFIQNYNYNQLVKEMVGSSLYQGTN
ncbi:MAG: hypothetical protein H7333_12285 [Bdellovibrionales bacterium]|nr:hypothetical protein [Oligoflexia bacterium]